MAGRRKIYFNKTISSPLEREIILLAKKYKTLKETKTGETLLILRSHLKILKLELSNKREFFKNRHGNWCFNSVQIFNTYLYRGSIEGRQGLCVEKTEADDLRNTKFTINAAYSSHETRHWKMTGFFVSLHLLNRELYNNRQFFHWMLSRAGFSNFHRIVVWCEVSYFLISDFFIIEKLQLSDLLVNLKFPEMDLFYRISRLFFKSWFCLFYILLLNKPNELRVCVCH